MRNPIPFLSLVFLPQRGRLALKCWSETFSRLCLNSFSQTQNQCFFFCFLIILSNDHLVDCNNLTVFKNLENWDREHNFLPQAFKLQKHLEVFKQMETALVRCVKHVLIRKHLQQDAVTKTEARWLLYNIYNELYFGAWAKQDWNGHIAYVVQTLKPLMAFCGERCSLNSLFKCRSSLL